MEQDRKELLLSTRWGKVGPTTGPENAEKRKHLSLPWLEPRSLCCPTRSQSYNDCAISALLILVEVKMFSSFDLCEVRRWPGKGDRLSQEGAWLPKVCKMARRPWYEMVKSTPLHVRLIHLQFVSNTSRVDSPLTNGTVLCLIRSGPSRLVFVFTDFSKTFHPSTSSPRLLVEKYGLMWM
jgi:hypothetical protein